MYKFVRERYLKTRLFSEFSSDIALRLQTLEKHAAYPMFEKYNLEFNLLQYDLIKAKFDL